jgi:ATP-binding cassette subfamily C protein CydC
MNGQLVRSSALAGAGLLIAVLSEASSVGLLALSGWFIAACAIAGATVFSTFSYVTPSGGVRAFALARIAGTYGKRIVLHAAALRQVAAARAAFYDSVAAGPPSHSAGAWSGELLDKAMADAYTEGMALIQDTAPVLVTCVLTAAAGGFTALTGFPAAAAVLVAGVAACALIAYRSPAPRPTTAGDTRTALRAEVVTAIDAWPELASLGAASQLGGRITHRLRLLDAQERDATTRAARRKLLVGIVATLTLTGVLLAAFAQSRTLSPTTLVLMALLAVGVLANAGQLPTAADARRDARHARAQLRVDRQRPESPQRTAQAMRVWLTDRQFGFADYVLGETALRRQRTITADIPRGGTLVITGRSGSGKTTLLRALVDAIAAADPGAAPPRLMTSVWSDDYLFTGTTRSNLRLAQPMLDDVSATTLLADLWLDRSGVSPGTPTGVGGRDLSGGEQRRIHLARAIATEPRMLVIDEPTSGLDAATAEQVLRALRRRLPDTTLILAMHEAPAYLAGDGSIAVVSVD